MKNPVVFLHGDFLNHTLFKEVGQLFLSKGHAINYIDFPGHGLTKFSDEYSDSTDFLKKYIEENKIRSPIFIAHSSGASIAAGYIEKTKNVSSIIFINPLLSRPKECNPAIDFDALLTKYENISREKFTGQLLVDYSKIKDENEIREIGFKTTDTQGFIKNTKFYLSLPEMKEIFNVKVPIVYIASINDLFMPLSYHEKTVSKMKNARFLKIIAGHNPFIKENAQISEMIHKNYDFIVSE